MSIPVTITVAPEDVEAHMPRVRFEAEDVDLPGKRNPGRGVITAGATTAILKGSGGSATVGMRRSDRHAWFAATAAIVACAGMLFAGLLSTADAETRFGWRVRTDADGKPVVDTVDIRVAGTHLAAAAATPRGREHTVVQ